VRFRNLLVVSLAILAAVQADQAAELKPRTAEAFDHYIHLTEQRIQSEIAPGGAFLWVDRLSDPQRQTAHQRLRAGELLIERMNTLDQGKPIKVPDGLIHHWMATIFIPNTSMDPVLRLVQDYDRHQIYYSPDVERSRIIKRNGDDFQILLRFRRTKVITVVVDTYHDVHYGRLDDQHVYSFSHTTRIQEVENPGKQDERERPVGDDHGFLWRLNTYWRLEQADGGVYVQCEAVTLTRDIPTGLGWLVGPFVEKVPRESLTFTLAATRKAIEQHAFAAAQANSQTTKGTKVSTKDTKEAEHEQQ
jgi:hypothetical protein